MKITPGTNKSTTPPGPKDSRAKSFTKFGAENPKGDGFTEFKKFEAPEGAKNLSHSIRKIENGYLVHTSYQHKGEYKSHEVYHPTDPLAKEGAGEESSSTFGHVKGLK